MCIWNDIGGCHVNQKHSEMPFRTLANMLLQFNSYRLKRFYPVFKNFEIFDPLIFFFRLILGFSLLRYSV